MGKIKLILGSLIIFSAVGCAHFSKTNEELLQAQIVRLRSQIAQLEAEKNKQQTQFQQAKEDLARRLQQQLADYKAKLETTERGLVISFLAEIFFDSGKAQLREEAKSILRQVAQVLNKEVVDYPVVIEGHTDNEPIKYSGWASNWELASMRALAVLHYLIDECGLDPYRLSAKSYGEYRPIADNDTPEGRQKNRRVEIVVLPKMLEKLEKQKLPIE